MKFAAVSAVLAAVVAASPAAAVTIDFDELRSPNGRTYVYGSYESDGFRLSSSACPISRTNGRAQCFITPVLNTNNIDRAGAALQNFQGSATISLERIDGGVFTLDSLVLASTISNATGLSAPTQTVGFTFNLADGSVQNQSRTIATTGLANRNLLTFDVGSVTSFSFRPTSTGFLQFDDINVTPAAIAAVPEPATWAMMIGGLGLVGGTMRRRREKTAFA